MLLQQSPFGNVTSVFLRTSQPKSEWNKKNGAVEILRAKFLNHGNGVEDLFRFEIGNRILFLKSSAEQLSVCFGIPRLLNAGNDVSQFNEDNFKNSKFYRTYLAASPKLQTKKTETSLVMKKSAKIDVNGKKKSDKNEPMKDDLHIKNNFLKAKIKELVKNKTDNESLVLMLELFMLSTLFMTTGDGGSVHVKYISMLEDRGKVSWPDVIHDFLIDSIKKKSPQGCYAYLFVR